MSGTSSLQAEVIRIYEAPALDACSIVMRSSERETPRARSIQNLPRSVTAPDERCDCFIHPRAPPPSGSAPQTPPLTPQRAFAKPPRRISGALPQARAPPAIARSGCQLTATRAPPLTECQLSFLALQGAAAHRSGGQSCAREHPAPCPVLCVFPA